MKLTKLTTDIENVSKLPDRPNLEQGYTANQLKMLFDKAGIDIKNYINDVLIEELASCNYGRSGADMIGSSEIDIIAGDTVQDKLISISGQIKELVNGVIPDGSVSPDKFSDDIASFLTSASIRCTRFMTAGEYTFEAERSGTYKITMVGAGAGGGINPANEMVGIGGGAGAGVVKWIDLSPGDLCTFTVGEKGYGLKSDENYELISKATKGGDTKLYLNGNLIATAQGGVIGLGARARSDGGDLNYSGGYPEVTKFYNSSITPAVLFLAGGNSILGNGSDFEEDEAGPGGGGYAATRLNGDKFKIGYDGADGAVIIEYIK
ncbi:MAG: hypothetical protein IJ323_06210 [Clostridia bacterium]|nr:hypothetical protein [Clostridia bacterium]